MRNDRAKSSGVVKLRWAASLTAVLLSAGCGSDTASGPGVEELQMPDIARNAALTMLNNLHVQELIRNGKSAEALSLIDANYLYQLALLRLFDAELANDEAHVRVRNRIVEKLQREWLQRPPRYLDEPSAEFLERVCSTIPGCPPGRVVGREPLPEVP